MEQKIPRKQQQKNNGNSCIEYQDPYKTSNYYTEEIERTKNFGKGKNAVEEILNFVFLLL